MATYLDVSKMIFGKGSGTVSSGNTGPVSGSSWDSSTSVRYGTVTAVYDNGAIDVRLDSTGETVRLTTDTLVKVGDRVTVVVQGGKYLVHSNAQTNELLNKAVKTVDLEYGLSDSSSIPPSEWTTIAEIPKGEQFLWMRQKLTDAKGNVTYGTASVIASATRNGNQLLSVREQYYLSTSSTEQVGGEWYYAQPIIEPGTYVWTRTELTWSNDTVTYSETVLASAINQSYELYQALSAKMQQNVDNITINIDGVRKLAQVGTALDSDVRSFFKFGVDSAGDPLLTIGSTGSPMVTEQSNKAQTYKYAGTAVLTIDGEHGRIEVPKLKLGDYELRGEGDSLRLVYVG